MKYAIPTEFTRLKIEPVIHNGQFAGLTNSPHRKGDYVRVENAVERVEKANCTIEALGLFFDPKKALQAALDAAVKAGRDYGEILPEHQKALNLLRVKFTKPETTKKKKVQVKK
jgi:hypothetical protein